MVWQDALPTRSYIGQLHDARLGASSRMWETANRGLVVLSPGIISSSTLSGLGLGRPYNMAPPACECGRKSNNVSPVCQVYGLPGFVHDAGKLVD